MALDLDKMKKKLDTLQNTGGGSSASAFWKPQEGEQTIRILSTEDGDPFKDYHFHYMMINGRTNSVARNAPFVSLPQSFGTRVRMAHRNLLKKRRSYLLSSDSSHLS